ncbi:hypothetical protein [Celeribacter arenosi]|uniref:Uncharacterized protein n=1 Tax=Celeribacter arenosi TaxID=792649 RepID=A0ABP7K2R8_9RHOB
MESTGKIIGIVSFVIMLALGAVVSAQFATVQGDMTTFVDGQMTAAASYDAYGNETDAPTLDVAKVAAPKNGSAAKEFEIVITDEPLPSAQIIIDDGSLPREPRAEKEPVDPWFVPEDATIPETAKIYFAAIIGMLKGEKRDSGYTMDCKKKKDGGKICSIVRES